MNMLRIYLTDVGAEGYYEGCSCCSLETHASIKDIEQTLDVLLAQEKQLKLLKLLLETYSENLIIYYFKEYKNIKDLMIRIDAGNKYNLDNTIQGTFYKDSYDNLSENIKLLEDATKRYKKVPKLFKEYMELENK